MVNCFLPGRQAMPPGHAANIQGAGDAANLLI
ncbi:hypothetical protein EAJG_02815 [Escherichia coli E267]|nr:hypothetical protein EAJG_02815 [Escherichia coli E267]